MELVIIYIVKILYIVLLIYAIMIALAYAGMAIISIRETIDYMFVRKNTDFNSLLASPLIPGISVIMPAYNESKSIVESIRSLLSLSYSDLELVVVNDGSTDDSLEKMIKAYDLEKKDVVFDPRLKTEEVLGIYTSKNPAYSKMIVIDKVNGGKSDALNAGMNMAEKELVACVDADCIFEPDALLKMAKPFMEPGNKRVIATGGVIRIANSCEVKDGKLEKVYLPKKFLARAQVLEYIRAFLLARMGWSRLNGLLIISGAFGLFDKEIAIVCGGYARDTVGEDMELVVRMRRYMHENNMAYSVKYIPDPLCWTEVPETGKILSQQRNRWTRGTIETIVKHRKLLLNPKYGVLGLVSYPFWMIFEWFGPVLEFLGIVLFAYLTYINAVHWVYFYILLGFVYTAHLAISSLAIFMEERTFSQYGSHKDIAVLIGVALVEPFLYHPRTLWYSVRGNISYLMRKKGWGKQKRVGFSPKTVHE